MLLKAYLGLEGSLIHDLIAGQKVSSQHITGRAQDAIQLSLTLRESQHLPVNPLSCLFLSKDQFLGVERFLSVLLGALSALAGDLTSVLSTHVVSHTGRTVYI